MYKGNENLRRAGENIDYTPEMIEEVMRCAEDPIHFAEAYFTVIHPDRGQELIKLYEFQKKMIKAYVDTPNGKSHSIVCVPRQAGKCFSRFVKINIKNKKTGEIKELEVEEFYDSIKTLSELSNKI